MTRWCIKIYANFSLITNEDFFIKTIKLKTSTDQHNKKNLSVQ